MRGERPGAEIHEGSRVRLKEVRAIDIRKDDKKKEVARERAVEHFGYDAKGRLARHEWAYPSREKSGKKEGGVKENRITREYVYDNRGRRAKELMMIEAYNDYGDILHESEHTYLYEGDEKQPIFETIEKDGNTMTTFENAYDAAGRLARRYTVSYSSGHKSERVEEFDYDAQGRVSERRQIDTDQSIIWGDTPNSIALFFRNSYDEQGRIIRAERGYVGSERPFGVITYEYSPDGREVTDTNFYGREKVWEFTKKLDEHGNPVELAHTSYKAGRKDFESTTKYENTYEPAV